MRLRRPDHPFLGEVLVEGVEMGLDERRSRDTPVT